MTNGSTGQEIWKMECTRWPGLLQGGQTLHSKPNWRIPPLVSRHRGVAAVAQNHGHVTKTCDQLLQLNKNPIKIATCPMLQRNKALTTASGCSNLSTQDAATQHHDRFQADTQQTATLSSRHIHRKTRQHQP